MNETRSDKAAPHIDYLDVEKSPKFLELKRRHRRFTFPLAIAFLAWYAAFVLLAALRPDIMGTRLGDSYITIGLLLGLAQFVTTFAITMTYVSFANRRLDPLAAELRAELEGRSAS